MTGADTRKAKHNREVKNIRKRKSKLKFVAIILVIACITFGIGWIKNNNTSFDKPFNNPLEELKSKASFDSPVKYTDIVEDDEEDETEEEGDSKLQIDMKLKL